MILSAALLHNNVGALLSVKQIRERILFRHIQTSSADYARRILEIEKLNKIDNQWIGSVTTFSHTSIKGNEEAPVALNKVVSNKVIFDSVFKYLLTNIPTSSIPIGVDPVVDTKSYISKRLNTNGVSLNSTFSKWLSFNSIPIQSTSRKYISNRISESSINSFRHDGAVEKRSDSNNTSSVSSNYDHLSSQYDMKSYIPEVNIHLDRLTDRDASSGRLLSKLFTFPLSLAFGLRQVCDHVIFSFQSSESNSNTMTINRKLKLLMVGARSECTLPRFLWREVMIGLGDISSSFHANNIPGNVQYSSSSLESTGGPELEVTFIGPGLPIVSMKSPKHTDPVLLDCIEWTHDISSENIPGHEGRYLSKISFTPLLPQYQCLLHTYQDPLVPVGTEAEEQVSDATNQPNGGIWQHVKATKSSHALVQQHDVICMFNPGIGYSYEQQMLMLTLVDSAELTLTLSPWFQSLVLILMSMKPVICTAHGPVDYERDIKYWQLIVDEINSNSHDSIFTLRFLFNSKDDCSDTLNPYCSHKWEVDTGDKSQPVLRPNSLIYVFQLVTL